MMIKGMSFSFDLVRKLLAGSLALLYFTILVVDTDVLHNCSGKTSKTFDEKISDKAGKPCCEDDSAHLKVNSHIKISAPLHSLRALPQAIVLNSNRAVTYVTSTSINYLSLHLSIRIKNASLLILYSILLI
jgi:hypothetical protein